MDEDKDNLSRRNLAGAEIGFEFAGSVGLFCLIGFFVDRHWQTAPFGLIAGAVVGFVVGTYMLVRKALVITENDKDRESS